MDENKSNNGEYIISLRELPEGTYEYDFLLTDDFFESIEATETQKGEVKVKVNLRKSEYSSEFKILSKGYVYVPCDRCMEDMKVDIDTEDKLVVKFGEEYEDVGDALIVIPELPGEIDLAWHIYEFIALNIPIRHVHPDGECVGSIANQLNNYLVEESPVENNESESEEIDPRWAGLKKLLDDQKS